MTSDRTLTVDVVTPQKVVYSDSKVHYVSAPASEGRVGILPAHMPMISTLDPGELRLDEKEGRSLRMMVRPGFIQVKNDHVIVLVEEAKELGGG